MKTVIPAHHSSAGLDLIHVWGLAEIRRPVFRLVDSPPLADASRDPMRPLGSLVLFVRGGQLQGRIQLLGVSSRAADCMLGTTFIARHFRAAVPPQQKVRFITGQLWSFLALNSSRPKCCLTLAVPKAETHMTLDVSKSSFRQKSYFLTNDTRHCSRPHTDRRTLLSPKPLAQGHVISHAYGARRYGRDTAPAVYGLRH